MGLMDKLRAELIDIVEWVDDSQHTLVWRFPRFHNQIKNGAQLIVRPGQSAIMVCRGKIADVFGPGQYSLETKNLPVLSTLMGWKYGFDSPFKSEVYFVNTTRITDLKWGTPNPVIMRDPDFGPVRVRAFGTYSLRAVDPETLLTELVGTDSLYEADEISEWLRSIVNSTFADVVASSGIAVLDLSARYHELSTELRDEVQSRIDDEYGLELPMLNIVNISLPAEVERALDQRSSMGVVGDLRAYHSYQMASAIPDAAANPAGGIAGAGMGLGMGMAMAGPMLQGPAGAGQSGVGALAGAGQGGVGVPGSAPQAPPPPPPPQAWHMAENGQSLGPMALQQLAEAVASGRLRPDTLVWTAGMAQWTAAAGVPQVAGLFRSGPPPIP